jgi:sodium/bile acid cotransporter 7
MAYGNGPPKLQNATKHFGIDPFILLLLLTVLVAGLFPLRGTTATTVSACSNAAIAALFFLHGARLSRQAVISGITAWRVHLIIVLATFLMFPLLGIAAQQLADWWLDPLIGAGIVLLCIMPSTIQSSIAFTAIAGGTVPSAVTSASASSMFGVVLSPLLAALLLSGNIEAMSFEVVYKIALLLLMPFLLGHAARPLLRNVVARHRKFLSSFDRGVILLIVYTAFSAAVVDGLWQRYSLSDLLWILLFSSTILVLALFVTTLAARRAGLSTEDEITVVFCGSKKSLASGVPIASAIFPAAQLGPLILPLMIFHQLQLIVCALLAEHYAARSTRHKTPPETQNPR